MVRKSSRQSRRLLLFFLGLGLVCLLAMGWIRRKDPKAVITRKLTAAGFSDREIQNWIAISAHETAGWTSRVYQEANNLVGMTLASRNTTAIGELPYGEHQAIYTSIESSADDLVLFLTVRYKYPKDFATLEEQIRYMKDRGYFGDSFKNYYAAVLNWKKNLFDSVEV